MGKRKKFAHCHINDVQRLTKFSVGNRDEFINDLSTDDDISGGNDPSGNICLFRVCPGIGVNNDVAVEEYRSIWHWPHPGQI